MRKAETRNATERRKEREAKVQEFSKGFKKNVNIKNVKQNLFKNYMTAKLLLGGSRKEQFSILRKAEMIYILWKVEAGRVTAKTRKKKGRVFSPAKLFNKNC